MGTQAMVPALVLLAYLLAGCGDGQAEPSEAAACVVPFRFEGKIYIGIDYASEPPARKLGVAEKATCDDIGPEVSVSFSEKPDQVAVWAYEGVDPDVAIGVRDATGDFVVLVAEDIPEAKAQRISDTLR